MKDVCNFGSIDILFKMRIKGLGCMALVVFSECYYFTNLLMCYLTNRNILFNTFYQSFLELCLIDVLNTQPFLSRTLKRRTPFCFQLLVQCKRAPYLILLQIVDDVLLSTDISTLKTMQLLNL